MQIPDFSTMRSEQVEKWLHRQLGEVELIGQLPLSEAHFAQLCRMIQWQYVTSHQLLISKAPPAVFVTSMVFTARYSGQNVRNFWEPYAQRVWDQREATQHFQNRCREHFISAIDILKRKFDFVFPRRTRGDVVRPVYRHAVIPYYLQDKFADWLKDRWQDILMIPPQQLVEQLPLDSSFRYLPPTLKSFIIGDETADAAQELLTTMATAAEMYVGGESVETIDRLLSVHPIERALWHELLKVYQEEADVVQSRQVQAIFEWLWSLENHEMHLRVRNLRIRTQEQPDRMVWVERDQDPFSSQIEARLLPWQQQGGWLIDECVLEPGPLNGQLVVLGEAGSILGAYSVPKLPADQPVMIFRPTQQNIYGVPVDLQSSALTDGLWFISSARDVLICDGDGHAVAPQENRPVPFPLNDHAGHVTAGLYDLELPLTIRRRELVIAALERKHSGVGKPAIVGNEESTLFDLSRTVPPAFTKPKIWLHVPQAPDYILNRGTLWIRSETDTIAQRLRELKAKNFVTRTDGDLYVALGDLLPDRLATYQVQIRVGLTPVFPSPLQFGYLPNIEIIPPDPDTLYTPSRPPTCEVAGVHLGQIRARPTSVVKAVGKRSVRITWRDLRDRPHFAIHQDDARVTLAWEVDRAAAWIDPEEQTYSLESLASARLHVVSTSERVQMFSVWVEGDGSRRYVKLNAKGRYTAELRQDPVYDLIREQPRSRVTLNVQMGDAVWKLAEIQKGLALEDAEIKILRDKDGTTLLGLHSGLDQEWLAEITLIASPLGGSEGQIVVAQTDRLAPEMVFPCELPDGAYQLQIVSDGEPLLKRPLAFQVLRDGRADKLELPGLSLYLGDQIGPPLPRSLQSDFVRLALELYQSSADSIPTAYRYRLATMAVDTLPARARSQLENLWPVITYVTQAHTDRYSTREDGLFPAWLVVDRPLHFKLILPRKHVVIRVSPEVAGCRATRGVGSAALKVRGSEAGADGVYVQWEIEGEDRYDVLLGLPDDPAVTRYSDLDWQVIWPLRQCRRCGDLVGARRSMLDDYLVELHRHGKEQEDLVDITYDIDLVAQMSPSYVSSMLRYQNPPSTFIDDSYIPRLTQQPGDSSSRTVNPVTADGHRYAVWRTNFRLIPTTRDIWLEWFTNQRWQAAFDDFGQELVRGVGNGIPAFRAMGRLLGAMEWDSGKASLLRCDPHLLPRALMKWGEGAAVLRPDRQLLMLALLLRGMAHHRGQLQTVIAQLGLAEQDLAQQLDMMNRVAPELLGWALAWAELMYVHALS